MNQGSAFVKPESVKVELPEWARVWSERELPRTPQNSPIQAQADQLPYPAPRAWEDESRWATASPESTASRHSNGWPKPKRRAIGTPERQSPESNWTSRPTFGSIHPDTRHPQPSRTPNINPSLTQLHSVVHILQNNMNRQLQLLCAEIGEVVNNLKAEMRALRLSTLRSQETFYRVKCCICLAENARYVSLKCYRACPCCPNCSGLGHDRLPSCPACKVSTNWAILRNDGN